MSCFGCGTRAVIEKDPNDELREKLSSIPLIYMDASYPSIISRDGILVSTLISEESLGIDLTSTISALKAAAHHFATILKLRGCSKLNICGENQIFSLYGLHNDYILVFFSSRGNMLPNFMVGDPASNEEIQGIIHELNSILIEKCK